MPLQESSVQPDPNTGANAAVSMVSTIDPLATNAAIEILRQGGNAIDAAIAANAVLSVTAQNMCGLGGDLLAIVYDPNPPSSSANVTALNSSGRSSKRASAQRLKAEGLRQMPPHGRIESVTVPGCVDGWEALLNRYGTKPLSDLLGRAIELAEGGFESSELFAEDAEEISHLKGAREYRDSFKAGYFTGTVVRRPGIAKVLEDISAHGRDGFYGGEFGRELVELSSGYFDRDDLDTVCSTWQEPVSLQAFGHNVYSLPPTSQGGLAVVAAKIASDVGLPHDDQDPQYLHRLIEAARLAGFDRNDWLAEGADFSSHFNPREIERRTEMFDPNRRIDLNEPLAALGDTMALCVIDKDGLGITLIQSNAASFGSTLFTPKSQVFLHNRGIGFSLDDSKPNYFASASRPLHTLSPSLVTTPDGHLKMLLGTMGGDSQPQILLQLIASALHLGQDPRTAVSKARFILAPKQSRGAAGFSTWGLRGDNSVLLEPDLAGLKGELIKLGHSVAVSPRSDSTFGHAHMIKLSDSSTIGFADPRSKGGICISD